MSFSFYCYGGITLLDIGALIDVWLLRAAKLHPMFLLYRVVVFLSLIY